VGAKNQKEGPKSRRGSHILKIQYWTYAAIGGPNVKWGAPISNGGPGTTSPPAGDGPDLNILSLPKIYTLSVGKFMHSYHNKLLPNDFVEYFIPISSIHSHSTRLATSNNLFLPRVNSSSGKCSLAFIGPKVWSSIPNHIKSSTTFTFKWKLKKHLLHDKDIQL